MKHNYSKFLPLLLFYFLLVIALSSNAFEADEKGYLSLAHHLTAGTYYSQGANNLWWGPGYPMVLTPFVHWELPILVARLLNPLLLFGTVLYFYKTLKLYIEEKNAIIITYCIGLYPPLMREIHLLMTENLVFFLVCGFAFHFCKLYQGLGRQWSHLLAASLYLGYLALTKVFFGYVILTGILLYVFLFIGWREDHYRKTVLAYVLALIWCVPYLLMTYSLTGKPFYWGSSGGASLYWMSTPYDTEMGDWFSNVDVKERPELFHHRDFYDKMTGLSHVEKDRIFKRQAEYNIIHYPLKYASNWAANLGRLFFSYPFSYTPKR